MNDLYDIDSLIKMSELFKILGDLTRLKIITNLRANEMSVTKLAETLNMSQSAISHQLKTLRNTNLVKNRRDGKNILYSLSDQHVYEILSQTLEHVSEE